MLSTLVNCASRQHAVLRPLLQGARGAMLLLMSLAR